MTREEAISRQAVLEMAYDMSEIDGEHFTKPWMVVDVEDIQKLPSVNPQEPTWIPVSERLPEDSGYCLTTTMYGEVYCDYWTGIGFDRQEAVIAWMPLPKPYMAESEE